MQKLEITTNTQKATAVKITERVKTFEDACQVLDISGDVLNGSIHDALANDSKAILAHLKLMVIAKAVKYYFRYADDIVILSDNKPYLHQILADIKQYLGENLKLTVKENYQIFPVEKRGIDFVGYVFYHTHTRIRKSIKQNFARMLVARKNPASIASYNGWLTHCNSKNLQKKLLKTA